MKNLSESKSPIQVIQRMARLLDAIAAEPGPASLKLLSAETGLHPSTAFRILASLAEEGYVERDQAGRYRLGVRLLQLAARVRARVDVRREAAEVMAWLRDQLGETVNLAVREGDEVVYVERVIPSRMMRVEQVIGSRAPLHVTAVGKLMLAEAGAEACSAYAERTGLPAFTRNTITDASRLAQATRDAQERGFALDDEEAELGVGCIGVPVRDASGEMVAGLSVSAPMERRREAWIPLVLEAGLRLSSRLGYGGCGAQRGPLGKEHS
jgi:DNA-binding IclR family transcriptional regulator